MRRRKMDEYEKQQFAFQVKRFEFFKIANTCALGMQVKHDGDSVI